MRITFLLFVFGSLCANGQSANSFPDRPKIVVGIVVDQMRQEYLYRFAPKFGEGGFKKLMSQGFMLSNGHYNYIPTYTGPGHASVYTGATPSTHGVIGNDWYDKGSNKMVNCVADEKQKVVGTTDGNGDVSPWRLLSTTVTDELELATQRRSKVIGVSIKDRGAVLPAGHTPEGAYWYDSKTGKFISSTFYKAGLPSWLDKFNALNLANKYLNETWNTLYPIQEYRESGPDDTAYEEIIKGKERPTFPYNLKELRKQNGEYALLPETPFGNEILTQLAMAAIEGEGMGKDEWTDFLALSYSSTDMIGHAMGPNSVEVEDTYIRLDRNIEELLKKLDALVGEGQYLVFLTSDHGVAEVPQYLKDLKTLNESSQPTKYETGLKDFLGSYYPGKNLIKNISNNQVFFDHEAFDTDPKSSGVEYLIVSELTRTYLQKQPGIASVFTRQAIQAADFNEGGVKGLVRRGFNDNRSGDVVVVTEPGWVIGSGTTGTTHGSGYTYDTHVPIIFYGFGVKQGTSANYHSITDIAPTVSTILKIKFPSGATGQPIVELLK
ncbi:MAG: alkaline phosphatase PafA [Cyclobacteriaceae bacterium]